MKAETGTYPRVAAAVRNRLEVGVVQLVPGELANACKVLALYRHLQICRQRGQLEKKLETMKQVRKMKLGRNPKHYEDDT